jgi:hypothetical protein
VCSTPSAPSDGHWFPPARGFRASGGHTWSRRTRARLPAPSPSWACPRRWYATGSTATSWRGWTMTRAGRCWS